MGISFRPAKRSGVKLMLALAGPSGCGKTYSALLLAKGIQQVDGGEIFVIDTENRRSEHYADSFRFLIGEMHAPFNPQSYLDAVEAAVAAGGKIIVIDSGSHMHEGEGGILDMHDALLTKWCGDDERKREKNNMRAWIEPKGELNRVVNRLLQIDAHFVFCFRAQEKVKPIGGKPTSIGIQPIASDRLTYEMTMRLVLPGEHKGVPDLDAPATKLPEPLIPMMLPGAKISVGFGRMLAEWARGDVAVAPEPAAASEPDPDQAQPSSPDAPASEAPSEPSQEDGASRLLDSYHRELAGAQDRDDLAARHEGSEHRGQFGERDREIAREILKLHTRRVKGDIGRVAFKEQIDELLAGVPA
ncbi:hypothetical protein ASG43_03190 [Aureimonas sp. Leaf454]|uniref:AAA family ATPase n=1 Tax=Aureimonas sp. Leaf454 TaxID=1736381 RepID=UPI0006F92F9E|nr:AAA family ATPase [Aureimonas sp. Leaf454]KQT54604.1 hypothetical protein ASG43_03190 [Aureimonas sp. Leaf454]